MTCPQCQAPLPADAPGGRCPACALRMALDVGTFAASEDGDPAVPGLTAAGPWRIVRLLGAGGMGAVYLAEQSQPLRRQAALKIVKPGLGSAEIIRRFESERQALALMDHPNIARVYDAGSTADGRPYFAMEYVDGVPITTYCDEHALAARERLRLFTDVCRAIQHAHQKGVIHRDIKPSNVLVAEREGKPVPTVIDFGIAKAVDHRLAGETIFTQQGLLVGTPEYMSPEQASSSVDIDTTTDVYSLGVLLYELLTGVLPIDTRQLRQAGFQAILRAVREDDPPRPVTRLRSLGETAAGLAEKRRTTVGGLLRQVGGDLEWITMRALEKERARRYASAAALADDIERHLRDEPVSAGPPGWLYQTRKFVRRNRALVAGAAGVFLALALGMALTTVQYSRAERETERAVAQSRRAEAEAMRAQDQTRRAENEAQRADQSATAARAALADAQRSRDVADTERQRAEDETETGRRLLYAADMSRAASAWEESNLYLLEELLDRHFPVPGKPDLRGWEWFYYWGRTTAGLKLFDGEGPNVAFSPDGKTMGITGPCDDNGNLGSRLWDLAAGSSRARVPWSFGRGIAFAPDGKTFVVSQYNEEISVFDSATAKEIAQIPFTGYQRPSFSPDGRLLAFSAGSEPRATTMAYRGVVKVWDLRERKEVATLRGTEGARSVAFSPDGRTITVVLNAGIRMFDAATFEPEPAWIPEAVRHFPAVAAYSRDGRLLAEGGLDGVINIWEVAARKKAVTLPADPGIVMPAGGINDLAFSPDGKLLAAARRDRRVLLFNAVTGAIVNNIRAHAENAATVAFSPDGKFLATGGSECRVRLWEVARIAAPNVISTVTLPRTALSGDGRLLAISGVKVGVKPQPSVSVWTMGEPATSVRTIEGTAPFGRVALSRDGRLLAAGDLASGITVWDTASGEQKLRLTGTRRQVAFQRTGAAGANYVPIGNFARFSPDGKWMAYGHDSGGVALREWATQRDVAVIGNAKSKFFTASFSPDGRWLAVAGDCTQPVNTPDRKTVRPPFEDCSPQIWSVPERKLRFRLINEVGTSDQLAWSPDSSRLAVLNDRLQVDVWNGETGKLVTSLRGAKFGGPCLQYSPDGRRIMVCDEMDLVMWDTASGQLVSVMRMGSLLTSALFSPDGRTLTVGTLGTVSFRVAADRGEVPAKPPKRQGSKYW